jgi:hypothetical protein
MKHIPTMITININKVQKISLRIAVVRAGGGGILSMKRFQQEVTQLGISFSFEISNELFE